MKVVQLYEQTPKQLSNLTPTKKPAHWGPKKTKMIPTLSQIQMSQLKETSKMKVVQLYEQTPKQFSNPSPTPQKKAHQGSQKSKMIPRLIQIQKLELNKA